MTRFKPLLSFMFLSAAAALALAGCGTAGTRGGSPEEAEARRVLSEMTADFQNGQADQFFGLFDSGSFPNFEVYRDQTRDFLLRNHQLTVDIVMDAVLAGGGGISVSAHWNRSFTDAQGAHKLEQGRCDFVFRERPSGGLALQAISGNSPF